MNDKNTFQRGFKKVYHENLLTKKISFLGEAGWNIIKKKTYTVGKKKDQPLYRRLNEKQVGEYLESQGEAKKSIASSPRTTDEEKKNQKLLVKALKNKIIVRDGNIVTLGTGDDAISKQHNEAVGDAVFMTKVANAVKDCKTCK